MGTVGWWGGKGGLVHEGREKISDGLKFPCLPFLLSLKITFHRIQNHSEILLV